MLFISYFHRGDVVIWQLKYVHILMILETRYITNQIIELSSPIKINDQMVLLNEYK